MIANVSTLAIIYQGVAFPVLIFMLDKRGNSHISERISIIAFNEPEKAQQIYKERWQIETAF